jgi:PilZ domain
MTNPVCPECCSEYVRRVRREGIGERLLSLFYVYPFSCQLCGERFSFFQRGVRYVRIDEEQRMYQRSPVNFPIAFANGEVSGKGRVGDISMGGCTVQTDAQMALGAIFQLSLGIPDAVSTITIDAARVRNVRLDRVGLEFLKFQKSERERLQNLVRGLLFARRGEQKATFDEARSRRWNYSSFNETNCWSHRKPAYALDECIKQIG